MKQIVWLCNVPTPKASEAFKLKKTVLGGWLFWLSEQIGKMKDYKLSIIFRSDDIPKFEHIEYEGINYFAIPNSSSNGIKYSKDVENYFVEILKSLNPDIIHIWGTEYSHSLAMVNASIRLGIIDKCIISIQGLVKVYAKYYFGNLDKDEIRIISLKDVLKSNTLKQGKKKYEKKGLNEEEAIKKVKNVIGRTDWDKAIVYQINSNLNYYFNNENLRDSFYENSWNYEKCQKHSIFVSQAHTPIKGVDVLLKALPKILKHYPDTKVYIGGYKNNSLIKRTSYDKILSRIIKKNKIENAVEFLGIRNEKEMVSEYLRANVFVCPSAIENSPNSIGEAMILGTPIVASYVGGTSNLLKDKEEGYLYQSDADYMLAYYVMDLFSNIDKAKSFSEKAKIHAKKTHNREKNLKSLLLIYEQILSGK